MSRWGMPHRRSDRGSNTVEMAVLMPVMLLLLMVVIQAAIWFHSRAVVTAAANKAVDAARVEAGAATDGHKAAQEFLTHTAALDNASINVDRNDDTASATVGADVISLMFGLPITVSVTTDAPIERVTG